MSKITEEEARELAHQFYELATKMDLTLMVRMKNYADRLGVPLWLCIQNILISDFARKQARVMVEGPVPRQVLPEFIREVLDDGTEQVMTGEALFNSLVEVYKREFEMPLRDQKLREEMAVLQAKYGKPDDYNVGIVELRKREADANFAKLPPETQAKIKRADARQREYEAKRLAERKANH